MSFQDLSSKPNVLLVAEPIVPGGIAVYVRSIMEGLTQADILHPLLTSAQPTVGLLPDTELRQVEPVSGLFWTFWRPFIFRKLVAWAREKEISLVHGLSALTAPVCWRLAQALNVPYVVTVHHFQKRGVLRVEKNCRGFIAVSESLRENLVNDAAIPKELVRVIPAAIHVPHELRPRPAEYLAEGDRSVPLVTTIGKLIPRKDHACFIRAAKIIHERLGSDCSFVIAGEGPDETNLRRIAKQLGMDKHITFAHGTATHSELLHDTDVYVQCSKVEGFGTMVLQAMAYGVPVVATSTGGLLTLVRDGETGYLVPVGDHEALAMRVMTLLQDHTISHNFAEAARQLALSEYNLEHMMKGTIELYAEALAPAPVSAD